MCQFCTKKRYLTFHDWRNHVRGHKTCLVRGWDDPILSQGYAAGLMLDWWFRFHKIVRDKEDATYQRVVKLRQAYMAYRKGEKDVIQGNPIPSRGAVNHQSAPHKGSMPDREKPATESELAESDDDSDESKEEGEVREEGDGDCQGCEEWQGREEWQAARQVEAKARRKEVTPSLLMGRGKWKAERGSGTVKRTRVESSSSERPDELGGSASKSSEVDEVPVGVDGPLVGLGTRDRQPDHQESWTLALDGVPAPGPQQPQRASQNSKDADGDADGRAKDRGACAHDLPRRLKPGDAGLGD